ncbi:hypothetical protein Tco_0705323 [Tanacetum coccineum]|uniref:Transposase Tnp1/En/Spm-like domain-containing protein n=1 Tax=Tanacetum coccineum TaxID=301880 RepID=A0ABQ4Y562_9ASTR
MRRSQVSFIRIQWEEVDTTCERSNILGKKEIEQDEEPTRGTNCGMKGRVTKTEEYQDERLDQWRINLKKQRTRIKEGNLVGSILGTDAMTHVLGKEKGGYARGVGKSQLDAARRERVRERTINQEYVQQDVPQTEEMGPKLEKISLAAQGVQLPVQRNGSIDTTRYESAGNRLILLGCDQNDASIQKECKKETVKSVGAKRTTRSIRKDSSQDSQSKEKCGRTVLHTHVLDAVGGFVAWPKNQVFFYPKATPPSTIQMITVENKTAPKVPTKRKNFYVSSDANKGYGEG